MNRRNFLVKSTLLAGAGVMSQAGFAKAEKHKTMDAAEYNRTRRYAKLPVSNVAYVERGHGRVALFLHGFPLNSFQWKGALERLSKHRRCIALDFMGIGHTQTPEGQDISPVAQAEMLAMFLDKLSIEIVDLVGSDSGGAVAQIFTAKYPNRVRTLLLTNCDTDENSPPPSFIPFLEAAKKGLLADGMARQLADKTLARSAKGLGGLTYTDPANLTDEAVDYYFSPIFSSPLKRKQFEQYAVDLGVNHMVAIRSELQKSTVPVRIVWGMADDIFEYKWAEWLDRTFPKSHGIRRVEGAKLFFPEEMPGLMAEELLAHWAYAGNLHALVESFPLIY
ncbi:MAG TPA: alpha/beta hydrolase [Candidatus Saccharimonadales bacterium]|nr:alpha/beta hydrolase [Candidatus Saccharimonadales bacterium]